MERYIYYHDTDCGGVVYYANYLKFLEEARTIWFKERGVNLKKLTAEGIWFVVSRIEAKYIKSARYGDIIKVETKLNRAGSCVLEFAHNIFNKENKEKILEAVNILACVGSNFKPMPIPQAIRANLIT